MTKRNTLSPPIHSRQSYRFVALLLAGAALAVQPPPTAAQDTKIDPELPSVRVDPRLRLAVAGFTIDPSGDPRDAWNGLAIEETLCWRLRRVPDLIAIPTVRLHQGRGELGASDDNLPKWDDVARGLGANLLLSSQCSGSARSLTVELTLRDLTHPETAPRKTTIGPERLFDVLEQATHWVLQTLELPELSDATRALVLAPPARSATVLEYYAQALSALRTDDHRTALRYASQALGSNALFRPALDLMAQLESRMGPAGRGSAARRLRALGEVARRQNDFVDRTLSELRQALILQSSGVFEAAMIRAKAALAIACEHHDVYGQMGAFTVICDLYVSRPVQVGAGSDQEAAVAFARENLKRAIEWQKLLIDLLEAQGDLLGQLPAVNKLALMYERSEQSEAALEAHKSTLALAQRLDSREHKATAWLYLGQWYRRAKRFQEAIEAFNRCMELVNEASRPTVRVFLGELCQAMSQPAEALQHYEKANEQLSDGDDLATQFTCLRQIATVRMEIGQRDGAISALREAIDIAHVLDLPEEARLRAELTEWESEAG